MHSDRRWRGGDQHEAGSGCKCRSSMLKAVFYARFHAVRGPSVIHQHPPQSIISSTASAQPLVTWSNITSYIIPPYDLCNQPLSICTEAHRVLAFPISIEDGKYDRNRFTFNICFVLAEQEDIRPWEPIVRKTAAFFHTMELEDSLLSAEESLQGLKWAGEPNYPAPQTGIVYPLLAAIAQGLNAYGECSAHVSDLHVLNLRLLAAATNQPAPSPSPPTSSSPSLSLSLSQPSPQVHAWDVPLLLRDLPDPQAWTWDLTLRRIHPFIDGIRHVARIAEMADVERRLVRRAVAELVRHRRACLLDLFHFQAVYAGTEALAQFVQDGGASEDDGESWGGSGGEGGGICVQDECRAYVSLNPTSWGVDDDVGTCDAGAGAGDGAGATAASSTMAGSTPAHPLPSRATVVTLYAALQPGTSLAAFCQTHAAALVGIDVRRFITFGILKGMLRRVHKFALAIDPPPPMMPGETVATMAAGVSDVAGVVAAMASSSLAITGGGEGGGGGGAANGSRGTKSGLDGGSRGSSTPNLLDDDAAAAAAVRDFDRAWKRAALSSGWATPPSNPPPPSLGRSHKSADQVRSEEDEKLRRYLDGRHCLDWICVEMHLSEQKVLERLRSGRFGEVVLISK